MEGKVFKGGVDIGNKNYKLSIEEEEFEFPIAYLEIDDYTFKDGEVGFGTKKVKYNDKNYLVGLGCDRILPRNKGDKNYKEVANMIKLTGLAEFLERKNLEEGSFKLVSGTPLSDYDEYKKDYEELLVDKKPELIQIDGKEYKIQVLDSHISKQCAAVAPTIPNWKEKENLILIDLGGGTADIAYFRMGSVIRYMTVDFTLNKIMEDLGNYLNSLGLGLMRPNETDSGFLHTIEKVVKDGKYLEITSLEVDGTVVTLSDVINKWLQIEVDRVIESISLRLDLSEAIKNSAQVYYFAGGTLLLRKELSNNQTFKNKIVLERPEFANVKSFSTIAKLREWN